MYIIVSRICKKTLDRRLRTSTRYISENINHIRYPSRAHIISITVEKDKTFFQLSFDIVVLLRITFAMSAFIEANMVFSFI